MIITAEFVFINRKLNEINNIIKNTQLEYEQKYGYNYYTEANVKCNVKLFDKRENKTKNIMIEHESVIGKVNKIMQSSKGMIKFFRALELTIRIQGRVRKNIVNTYLKCDNIPILWKKYYLKIAHDRGYKYIHIVVKDMFMIFLNLMDVVEYSNTNNYKSRFFFYINGEEIGC